MDDNCHPKTSTWVTICCSIPSSFALFCGIILTINMWYKMIKPSFAQCTVQCIFARCRVLSFCHRCNKNDLFPVSQGTVMCRLLNVVVFSNRRCGFSRAGSLCRGLHSLFWHFKWEFKPWWVNMRSSIFLWLCSFSRLYTPGMTFNVRVDTSTLLYVYQQHVASWSEMAWLSPSLFIFLVKHWNGITCFHAELIVFL